MTFFHSSIYCEFIKF